METQAEMLKAKMSLDRYIIKYSGWVQIDDLNRHWQYDIMIFHVIMFLSVEFC